MINGSTGLMVLGILAITGVLCRYSWHLCCKSKEKVVGAMQAKIDALMLEYCPTEMTHNQIKNWENHQVKSSWPTDIGEDNE